ncbi:MAG: hypothetical protein ACP5PX_01060 [Candidatus Hadarchaeum sp.]|uniref:hypothetical protein n=1 Tax=Candidatus Hadarchaeum sp. TaxID=2883567 RepID=UPI003D0B0E62
MEALDYLAMAVLAAVFIGIGFTMYFSYQQGAAEREFEYRAQLLAERIQAMAAQDVGSIEYIQIFVPAGCELSFSDNAVSIKIGGVAKSFPVGIPVSGPVYSGQNLNLIIRRVEEGVYVGKT